MDTIISEKESEKEKVIETYSIEKNDDCKRIFDLDDQINFEIERMEKRLVYLQGEFWGEIERNLGKRELLLKLNREKSNEDVLVVEKYELVSVGDEQKGDKND